LTRVRGDTLTPMAPTDPHPNFAPRMVHRHRNVQGGWARASVFGVSDGLVSNVALILGVAGAAANATFVLAAGLSGLIAGAVSMASGEYVSVKAQNELIEREIEIERKSLELHPEAETNELAGIYESRGVGPEQARRLAIAIMADPVVALDVHAREELGIAPSSVASPLVASSSSFGAFAVGAILPVVPWFFGSGAAATWASLIIGLSAAALVGFLLATFTERSRVRTVTRQVLLAAGSCGVTFLVGKAVGSNVG
jgi:VIT1/CCC1 family predicted Fe2+/Mn2+ transporter